MHVRTVFWIAALAYAGLLLTSETNLASPSMMITAGFLGALSGLILSYIFLERKYRRERRAGRWN
jgi:hypothetical protein